MRLSGPLTKPGKWDFETAGELEGLIVGTSFLPEPLAVSSGKFNLSPQRITVADLQAKLLSASLTFQEPRRLSAGPRKSRVVPERPGDSKRCSVALRYPGSGTQGSAAFVRRDLAVELSWRKGADVGLRGDLIVQNGPEISLDLLRHSNGIKIKSLVIRDGLSDASIGST